MNDSTDNFSEEVASPAAVRRLRRGLDLNTSEDQEDERLQLAAEMGQMLLAKNQEMEERIGELEEQLAVVQEECDQLRKSVATLSPENKELQTMHDQQASRAARATRELTEAREQLTAQQQQEQHSTRTYEEALHSLRQRIESLQQQLDSGRSKEEPLLAKITRLRTELQTTKDTLSATEAELQNVSRELSTARSQLDLMKSVEAANKTLKTQVQQLLENVERLEHCERENSELRSHLAAAEAHTKELTERYENERRALESTRRELSLQQEMLADSQPVNSSMLDELALDVQARMGAKQSDPHNRSQEDFFFLTAVSVKMNASERKQELMCRISSKDLYKRALAEQVPFYQYYTWITYQLDRLYAVEEQKPGSPPVILQSSPPPLPPRKTER